MEYESTVWLVWVRGTGKPAFSHDTLESAQIELERLAILPACAGRDIYILADVLRTHTLGDPVKRPWKRGKKKLATEVKVGAAIIPDTAITPTRPIITLKVKKVLAMS